MRARGDDGFTLVEMLVSLTLLAIAGVLLAQGFVSAAGSGRGWRLTPSQARTSRPHKGCSDNASNSCTPPPSM